MDELNNFEDWLESLPLQTLTDELKDDIMNNARAMVSSLLLRFATDVKAIRDELGK